MNKSGNQSLHAAALALQDCVRAMGREKGCLGAVAAAIADTEAATAKTLQLIRQNAGENPVAVNELVMGVRSAKNLGSYDGSFAAARRVLRHVGVDGGADSVEKARRRGIDRAEALVGDASLSDVVSGLTLAVVAVVNSLRQRKPMGGAELNEAALMVEHWLRINTGLHPDDMVVADLVVLTATDRVVRTDSGVMGALLAASRIVRFLSAAGVNIGGCWTGAAGVVSKLDSDEAVISLMHMMDGERDALAGAAFNSFEWHGHMIALRAMNEAMLRFLRDRPDIQPEGDNIIHLDLRVNHAAGDEYFGVLSATSAILTFLAHAPGRGYPDLIGGTGKRGAGAG